MVPRTDARGYTNTMPQVFSFSRMTSFEQCARRYRYRYLDGVKEGFRSVEAFMGQQVHEALEWLYGSCQSNDQPTADQAVAHYCATWDAELASTPVPVRVVRDGESIEQYRRMGAQLVADFSP